MTQNTPRWPISTELFNVWFFSTSWSVNQKRKRKKSIQEQGLRWFGATSTALYFSSPFWAKTHCMKLWSMRTTLSLSSQGFNTPWQGCWEGGLSNPPTLKLIANENNSEKFVGNSFVGNFLFKKNPKRSHSALFLCFNQRESMQLSSRHHMLITMENSCAVFLNKFSNFST